MIEDASTGHLYPWGHQKPYNDLSGYFRNRFGERIQKLSIHAGFTCPNRDGKVGWGGCTYCNNLTFTPDYCETTSSVTEQLEKGKAFFSSRNPGQRYLAYFQSYTNTYGATARLIELYEEAIAFPGVIGLVVGTRPDCISDDLLDFFSALARDRFVSIEFGIESTRDDTLHRINRGHTFAQAREAVVKTSLRGIHVGGHFILGLPGESEQEVLSHSKAINALPLDSIKLHQLQIISGTAMASEYQNHPEEFYLFEVERYIDLVIRFLELLDPRIIVERFVSESKTRWLIAPHWGLKNHEVANRIVNEMVSRNTWQGRLFM